MGKPAGRDVERSRLPAKVASVLSDSRRGDRFSRGDHALSHHPALRAVLLCAFALVASASRLDAADSPVAPPAFKAGDTWVFDQTDEHGQTGFQQRRVDLAIERLDDETMMLGIKLDGAPTAFEDHLVGTDWSQRRVVDGQETTTTRPFSFPMAVGQTWTIDYVDTTRRGPQTSDHVHRTYKVVGWEDVTVPAGTFHALKVEARGVDKGTIEVAASAASAAVAGSGGATTMSHTQRGGAGTLTRATYAEFYYVPALKNYAKSIEEQYDTDNVRVSRETRLLVSFKLAG